MIALADYPQLHLIAWNRRGEDLIEEQEALALYEANWRFVAPEQMEEPERQLLLRLIQQYGHGVLNV